MGDKICLWFETELPGLTRWIGGMGEWEAVAFAVGLMVLGYLIYAAAWNVWLCGAEAWDRRRVTHKAVWITAPCGGSGGRMMFAPADVEPYEPWMDKEKWRAE